MRRGEPGVVYRHAQATLHFAQREMFSEMLRGGSLWMPLGFAICGGMCGGLFNLIYDAVLPDPFQNPGIGGPNAGPGAGPGGALVFPCFLVIGPLIISAIVLVLALIMHGILLALGVCANFRSSRRSARSRTAGVGGRILANCPLRRSLYHAHCSGSVLDHRTEQDPRDLKLEVGRGGAHAGGALLRRAVRVGSAARDRRRDAGAILTPAAEVKLFRKGW